MKKMNNESKRVSASDFNKGLDFSKYTDWPYSPLIEVMQRRVFANLKPVGSPKTESRPKSGDPQFDLFMEKILGGSNEH